MGIQRNFCNQCEVSRREFIHGIVRSIQGPRAVHLPPDGKMLVQGSTDEWMIMERHIAIRP